jgi:hypothetical protein
MQTTQHAYFSDYRSLKMARDAQGVLIVEFHTDGGPLTFTAQDHTDFVDAFYRIAQDRINKIVILTGTAASCCCCPNTFSLSRASPSTAA